MLDVLEHRVCWTIGFVLDVLGHRVCWTIGFCLSFFFSSLY